MWMAVGFKVTLTRLGGSQGAARHQHEVTFRPWWAGKYPWYWIPIMPTSGVWFGGDLQAFWGQQLVMWRNVSQHPELSTKKVKVNIAFDHLPDRSYLQNVCSKYLVYHIGSQTLYVYFIILPEPVQIAVWLPLPWHCNHLFLERICDIRHPGLTPV